MLLLAFTHCDFLPATYYEATLQQLNTTLFCFRLSEFFTGEVDTECCDLDKKNLRVWKKSEKKIKQIVGDTHYHY